MTSPQLLTVLSVLSAAASCGCAYRLYRSGLVAKYPEIFGYLVVQALIVSAESAVGSSSPVYAYIFVIGYPLTCILYCFIVRGLYKKLFIEYPGIYFSAKISLYLSLAIAVFGAIATGIMTKEALAGKKTFLIPVEFGGRSLVLGLAVLTMCLIFIMYRYPIKVHQNVLVNCACFSVLLFLEAGTNLADHLTALNHTVMIDEFITTLNIGSFIVWASLLSPEKKGDFVRPLHPTNPELEQKRLRELNAISSALLRAAGK